MGSITHAKVSAIADDPAASAAGEVLPSDWNHAHVFSLVKADVGLGNVDNTSDANKPVSTAQAAADAAVQAFAIQRANHTGTQLAATISDLGTAALLASDTDTSLSANSDSRLATQKAVKAYIDALLTAQDALVFKGGIDCSASPNYPAADAGHFYKITVAGKIGGASGAVVQSGDSMYCTVDGSAAGTQAAVGANWVIVQVNIDGAVVGPASAVDSRVVVFDGATGKLIKDSGLTLSGANTGDETGARIATLNHAASVKSALLDADEITGQDSAVSFGLIRTTWTSVKAFLKTYFDTLYCPIQSTGTWTPVLTFTSAGNLTVVYGVQLGTYTKIGRLVTLFFNITTSTFTWTTSTGNLSITGSPFTNSTNIISEGTLVFGTGITKASYTQFTPQIAQLSNVITIVASGSGQPLGDVTTANTTTGTNILVRGSITFEA